MKMRTMLLALLLAAAFSSVAKAYEVVGNPDRRISFGLNYDRSSENSEYKFMGSNIPDFTKVSGDSFLMDVRLPLSSFFTFSVRGGFLKSKNEVFTGEEIEYNGYDVGAGIRLYLP